MKEKLNIHIAKLIGNRKRQMTYSFIVAEYYVSLGKYNQALPYSKSCINIAEEIGDVHSELKGCYLVVKSYGFLGQYSDAIVYINQYIKSAEKIGHEQFALKGYYILGVTHDLLGNYEEAIEYSMKCVDKTRKSWDQQHKIKAYLQLGKTYFSLKQYKMVITYCKICFRNEPKACHLLVKSYAKLGEYDREAISCCKECIQIANQLGDKPCVMDGCLVLAKASSLIEKYEDAIIYSRKCIRIGNLICDKSHEIDAYCLMVEAYCCLKEYEHAITQGKTCIDIAYKANDKHALTNVYYFLGEAYYSLKNYDHTISCCAQCIDNARQTCDVSREMEASLLLANVYYTLKQYEYVIIYATKCIANACKRGNKLCETEALLLMGKSYFLLKKYECSIKYSNDCIFVAKETGYIKKEIEAYAFQAQVFLSIKSTRDFILAITNCLVLAEEICDFSANESVVELIHTFLMDQKHDEKSNATENGTLQAHQIFGNSLTTRHEEIASSIKKLFALHEDFIQHRRNHHFEEAIAILTQIIDLELGSMDIFLKSYCSEKIGHLYLKLEQVEEAIRHFDFGMSVAKHVRPAVVKNIIIFKCSRFLGLIYFQRGQTENSIICLRESICCIDFYVKAVENHESIIIDLIDKVNDCYNYLAKGLIIRDEIIEALLVLEQCNAKALKIRLISMCGIKERSEEEHIMYPDIVSLVSSKKYAILFYSVFPDCLYRFQVECGRDLQFKQFPATRTDIERSVEALLKSYEAQQKEDKRSPDDKGPDKSCNIEQELAKVAERILAYFGSGSDSRAFKEPCENVDESSITNDLEFLYCKLFGQMSIEEDEIVIIPNGPLGKVPFAALRDPNTEKYLSETKRIRMAPSITILKLLEEVPVDKQCRNPALVVGNPLVGEVMLDGKKTRFRQLDDADREACIISDILNVMPLTRERATKTAVMERLQRGASVVHIAAHSILSKATIVLAPSPEIRATKIPDEEDYMLTMADVQKAQVRAQLVVLSCCHSGCGKIRAEGVVGMCRAFLASGARAVVASHWAINDEAAFQFMERFYRHIKAGESASRSLQKTINEMRRIPRYSAPGYWAPFFLMGDDVTINLQ